MRHARFLTALFVLSLCLPAAPAAAGSTTAATSTTDQVTVSGTVSYANGSAASDVFVLVGSTALFEKSSPERLRKLARDDPQDVAVTRTGADGAYSLTVNTSRVDAEAVVAVGPAGVSEVRKLDGGGTVDLTLHTAKPLQVEVTSVVAEPGGRSKVTISVKNTGDEPVRNLRVKVSKLPEGWNVVATRSEGATYHRGNRTFVWQRVASGAWAEAQMRIFVSVDAETKTYEFPVFADSDTHPVTAENLTVKVRYPTESPSETAVPVGENGDSTGISAPGFGSAVALVALLAAGFLAVRRP